MKELREVQEERLKAQASIKISPDEMEQIYATLSSKTSASSKSKLIFTFMNQREESAFQNR